MHRQFCFSNFSATNEQIYVFIADVRIRARIIIKIKMLVHWYTDSLSFKFYENPFIGCREIAKTKSSMHIYHF